ncbi:ShlB/FhaC/HecB family hemolysin secretion/activation protein [Sphingomonas tabacisoli]|uniref:ShlB/FhaC/HecB family hemolysin secretion/activation protein n=1 Tax=Sphingomonas tabacisoli TaxID=2249466 RepID=A0ABW4I349_9SPHN
MRSVRAAFVGLSLSAAWFPALAQTVPPTGTTREEIERARPAPAPLANTPGVTVESDFERAPCPLADPKYKDITFELREVQFGGLRSIPADLVRPAYADLVGKTVSVAEICEIRDRAATILRREGYLAAVQVPPQRIENGVIRFDALVAKLVGVQVRGQTGRSEELIAAYLRHIQNQDVFNIREAERYLLLARDIPGLDVRLILRPANAAPGEVIGEVTVTRVAVEADAYVQNLGSRSVGRWGGLARVQLNDLTGLGDRTTLSVFSTLDFDEQQVIEGGHSFKIGGEGLTFSGDVSYAWTRPSLTPQLDIKARTLSAFAELSYPFLRSQTQNLFGSAGLNVVNQNVDFNDTALTRDHIRVAYARLDYDSVDPRSIASTTGFSLAEPHWRVAGGLELRQGLDLNASNRCVANQICLLSRSAADPTAFVARATALVEYRPMPHLAFSIAPRAQYAPNSLVSYEQFSVGNFTTGRGYDPGALTGDSGLGFQSEVRVGSLLPRTIDGFAFQPYAFADLGIVWNHVASAVGQPDPQRLWSVGGGVRAAWGQRARLDVTLAAPLNRTPVQPNRDVRLLVTLSTKLLPWRR